MDRRTNRLNGELVCLKRRLLALNKVMDDFSATEGTESVQELLRIKINDTAESMLRIRDMIDGKL